MFFGKISLPVSEELLIEELKQKGRNSIQAENHLFTTFQYFIQEGKTRYSLSDDEAFDAYSDTIIQTIINITSGVFEKKSSLKTYLYRIFNNKCVDLIRKKTTNKYSIHQTFPLETMMLMIADSAKTIIQEMVENTDWQLLKQRLAEMGENCRQLLTLFAEGHSDKEIAETMLYKTADVVKTSRLRCLEKLKQLYKN